MLGTLQDIIQQVNAAASLDEALNIIVRRVKQAMVADACSVFVRNATTDQYVLMASEGLNPEAVGKVRLAANEGIVGLVTTRQKTINLDNAADHPNYRYFPETGEERYWRSAKRWFICTGSLGKNSSRVSPYNAGASATIRTGTNFRVNVGRLHAAHRALEVILALAGIKVLDG